MAAELPWGIKERNLDSVPDNAALSGCQGSLHGQQRECSISQLGRCILGASQLKHFWLWCYPDQSTCSVRPVLFWAVKPLHAALSTANS